MGSAAIDVKLVDVSKRYGNVLALDNVSLEIRQGEFVAFLGPSGSGKTTMLRIIAGLTEPSAGLVYIRGQLVNDVPVHRRALGMVFQNYALFPHMTVFENVAFGLRMRRLPEAEIRKRVAEALELVQLPEMGSRYPHQLSGGQQQRVALARCFAIRPSVLLLDEPLGALDKKLREAMQVELRSLQRQLGITTVFVTHDQEEALTMSDRIAVMSNGRVEQIGTPLEIYEHPQTRFVSDFIGVCNFLHGTVRERTGDHWVVVTDRGVPIRIATARALSPGQTVTVAIRPEKIQIGFKPAEGPVNQLKARIENAVYLGTMMHYYLTTDEGHRLIAFTQNVQPLHAGLIARPGDVVYLAWVPEANQILSD